MLYKFNSFFKIFESYIPVCFVYYIDKAHVTWASLAMYNRIFVAHIKIICF